MKNRVGLKIFGIIIAFLAVFMLTINIIPPTKVMKDNPFINLKDVPMLAAHRGGSIANPENTLKAYKAAVSDYQVDIMESDLWLTKDNKLVYNHDGYIDETCDVNGDIPLSEVKQICKDENKRHYISDYTLDELQEFNFGYYFVDKDGNRPYYDLVKPTDTNRKEVLKANDLQIVEVNDLFETFYQDHKELLFIVEIKNGGEQGFKAANILDDLLTNKYPDYKNRVVIGTFHDEIEQDLKVNHPTLLRGASTGAAAKFIITEMLKVNIFDNSSFACLQIPMSYDVGIEIALDKRMYIERSHRRNIAVQYWTINDEDEMRHLIELGCDAIMTDDPELLRSVLNEYKK